MEMTLKRGLCHFHDICDFCPLMSPGLPGLRLSPVSFPLETGSIGELGGQKVAYGSTVSEERVSKVAFLRHSGGSRHMPCVDRSCLSYMLGHS